MFPNSCNHITMSLGDKGDEGGSAFDESSNTSMVDRDCWKPLDINDESKWPAQVAHSRTDETQYKKARKDKLQPEAVMNSLHSACVYMCIYSWIHQHSESPQ